MRGVHRLAELPALWMADRRQLHRTPARIRSRAVERSVQPGQRRVTRVPKRAELNGLQLRDLMWNYWLCLSMRAELHLSQRVSLILGKDCKQQSPKDAKPSRLLRTGMSYYSRAK